MAGVVHEGADPLESQAPLRASAEARWVLRCVVVTPDRALLDQTADFVALPMYDGELGVLRGRSPLIGRLGCGELRIRKGKEVQRFFVDGGFAQIKDTVRSFKELCEGKWDHLPEQAFMYVGGIDEAAEQAKRLSEEGK